MERSEFSLEAMGLTEADRGKKGFSRVSSKPSFFLCEIILEFLSATSSVFKRCQDSHLRYLAAKPLACHDP